MDSPICIHLVVLVLLVVVVLVLLVLLILLVLVLLVLLVLLLLSISWVLLYFLGCLLFPYTEVNTSVRR